MANHASTILHSFSGAAAQAVCHLSEGAKGRNQAARLLLDDCGGRLMSYIRTRSYRKASDQDAEEIMMSTVMAFVTEPIPTGCSPDAWLFTICRNQVIDWARKCNADKRGGKDPADVDLDDDEMGNLFDTSLGHTELPGWVRDCVQKAAAFMQQTSPGAGHGAVDCGRRLVCRRNCHLFWCRPASKNQCPAASRCTRPPVSGQARSPKIL
ncbi:MAG: hypothetical protein IPN53_21525 [Comamonadaceae bacterium]|nr:hypothetical protein [Comamonadaceae bacterium]